MKNYTKYGNGLYVKPGKPIFKITEEPMIKYKVLIAGTRTFTRYDMFCIYMDVEMGRIEEDCAKFGHTPVIISGGALGTDAMAKRYAKDRGYLFEEYPADWDTYGRAAGPIRNKIMVEKAAEVFVFWDGISRGTYSTISLTKEAGKVVTIFPTKGR